MVETSAEEEEEEYRLNIDDNVMKRWPKRVEVTNLVMNGVTANESESTKFSLGGPVRRIGRVGCGRVGGCGWASATATF